MADNTKLSDDLKLRLDAFRSILFEIRSTYLAWRTINIAINITVLDKETAEDNLDTLNCHKGWFAPVLSSLQQSMIIELHKLFDTGTKVNSIESLIKDLKFAGFDYSDEYVALKEEYQQELKSIEVVRHTYYAHLALKRPQMLLPSVLALESLIESIWKFMSQLSCDLTGSFWAYEKNESLEATRDTLLMIENLDRGEASRKSNIYAEARKNILEGSFKNPNGITQT